MTFFIPYLSSTWSSYTMHFFSLKQGLARIKAFFSFPNDTVHSELSVYSSSNLISCFERLCEVIGQTRRKDDCCNSTLAIYDHHTYSLPLPLPITKYPNSQNPYTHTIPTHTQSLHTYNQYKHRIPTHTQSLHTYNHTNHTVSLYT